MAEDTYVPCTECEGDGCHGPNPAEDQCERCDGTGCEPPEVSAHDHACCPPDDCCGGPCDAHPCWDLTT